MILHIDMDAFYASVEERDHPELAGRPLVVGGRPEARGVVAAANYAARDFGIFSAMPSAAALRRCPHVLILAPRPARYAEVAAHIREIFGRYTPQVEPLSLDEAFLDPRGSERLHGSATDIGRRIKADIRSELGLVASVGIAANKFLAKLASDHGKPDGFTVILPQETQSFLDPLPVERMWGVGAAAAARLHAAGIRHIGQLRNHSSEHLRAQFGALGEQLWHLAHGVDERRVTADSEVKSISQETTFATDITAYPTVEATALGLTEGVSARVRAAARRGRTVHLKLRFADFTTVTRAHTLARPTFATDELWAAVNALLQRALGARFSVRLVGVGVSGFIGPAQAEQGELFADADAAKRAAVDAAVDEIRRRYPESAIRRGKSLGA